MNTTNLERLETVNKLISFISARGRRFFYSEESMLGNRVVAHMIIKGGRIYYIDNYTEEKIFTHNRHKSWNGFSHGVKAKALICEFRDYIIIGKETNGKHGFDGIYCKRWGYDYKAMLEIANYAKEIGYISE